MIKLKCYQIVRRGKSNGPSMVSEISADYNGPGFIKMSDNIWFGQVLHLATCPKSNFLDIEVSIFTHSTRGWLLTVIPQWPHGYGSKEQPGPDPSVYLHPPQTVHQIRRMEWSMAEHWHWTSQWHSYCVSKMSFFWKSNETESFLKKLALKPHSFKTQFLKLSG